MKTIHKFEIDRATRQTVLSDPDAKILRVGMQGNKMYLWAIVDTEAEPAPIEIAVFGTGSEIPDNVEYVGSVSNSPYEWHVFEILEG